MFFEERWFFRRGRGLLWYLIFLGVLYFFLVYVKLKWKKFRKLIEIEINSMWYRLCLVIFYNKRWLLIIFGCFWEVIFVVGISFSSFCCCREVEIRVNVWFVWWDNKNWLLGRFDCNLFFCFFNLLFSRLYGR